MMPMGRLAQDFFWRDAFISRVARMVRRDRNHPSVIFWSLGNESGRGRNLTEALDLIRGTDPTRPVAYEGGGSLFEGTGTSELTDIVCTMYPTVDQTVDLGTREDEGRPVILCEYSHAMGNSNGSLDEYWKHFWDQEKPRLQGGFIWDMIDQGLRKVDRATGREYFSYGDVVGGDRQFCINGLFSPDREPHPAVAEAKYLQQPVSFALDSESSSGVKLIVTNRYSFESTDHLKWEWSVVSVDKMSEVRAKGSFSLAMPGGNSTTIARISFGNDMLGNVIRRGQRCWLSIRGSLAHDMPWALEGHTVVEEQVELNPTQYFNPSDNGISEVPPSILQSAIADVTASSIQVQNDKVSKLITVQLSNSDNSQKTTLATIDASTGTLLSYNTPQGCSVLDIDNGAGMQPNFTRAATDNDKVRPLRMEEYISLVSIKRKVAHSRSNSLLSPYRREDLI